MGRAGQAADLGRGAVLAAVRGAKPPALLDVRWELAGGSRRQDYLDAHLPGAAFVDLDAELATPPGRGGRHPLPDQDAFQSAMRRAGVEHGRPVVAYDPAGGTARRARGGCCVTRGHESTSPCSTADRGVAAGRRARSVRSRPWHPVTSRLDRGRWGCSTPPGRPRSPATACCSTRGRRSATAASTSRSIPWPGTSPARATRQRPRTSTDPGAFWRPGASGRIRVPRRARRRRARGLLRVGDHRRARPEVLALELAGYRAALTRARGSDWITDPRRRSRPAGGTAAKPGRCPRAERARPARGRRTSVRARSR